MKKIYIIPETHMVNLNLLTSVLGGEPSIGKWSQGAAGGDEPGWADAKGNDDVVEDDDDLGNTPMQTDWNVE